MQIVANEAMNEVRQNLYTFYINKYIVFINGLKSSIKKLHFIHLPHYLFYIQLFIAHVFSQFRTIVQ